MKLIIINGVNLNLTGTREIDIYGKINFDEYIINISRKFQNHIIEYYQSNIEGEIVNKLHQVGFTYDGIILNPGAYSHYSIAIADAVKAIKTKVIEVHLSNIFAREDFRKNSITAQYSIGSILGLGLESYNLAINYFINLD